MAAYCLAIFTSFHNNSCLNNKEDEEDISFIDPWDLLLSTERSFHQGSPPSSCMDKSNIFGPSSREQCENREHFMHNFRSMNFAIITLMIMYMARNFVVCAPKPLLSSSLRPSFISQSVSRKYLLITKCVVCYACVRR